VVAGAPRKPGSRGSVACHLGFSSSMQVAGRRELKCCGLMPVTPEAAGSSPRHSQAIRLGHHQGEIARVPSTRSPNGRSVFKPHNPPTEPLRFLPLGLPPVGGLKSTLLQEDCVALFSARPMLLAARRHPRLQVGAFSAQSGCDTTVIRQAQSSTARWPVEIRANSIQTTRLG
jgi:hypothetical protein